MNIPCAAEEEASAAHTQAEAVRMQNATVRAKRGAVTSQIMDVGQSMVACQQRREERVTHDEQFPRTERHPVSIVVAKLVVVCLLSVFAATGDTFLWRDAAAKFSPFESPRAILGVAIGLAAAVLCALMAAKWCFGAEEQIVKEIRLQRDLHMARRLRGRLRLKRAVTVVVLAFAGVLTFGNAYVAQMKVEEARMMKERARHMQADLAALRRQGASQASAPQAAPRQPESNPLSDSLEWVLAFSLPLAIWTLHLGLALVPLPLEELHSTLGGWVKVARENRAFTQLEKRAALLDASFHHWDPAFGPHPAGLVPVDVRNLLATRRGDGSAEPAGTGPVVPNSLEPSAPGPNGVAPNVPPNHSADEPARPAEDGADEFEGLV